MGVNISPEQKIAIAQQLADIIYEEMLKKTNENTDKIKDSKKTQ